MEQYCNLRKRDKTNRDRKHESADDSRGKKETLDEIDEDCMTRSSVARYDVGCNVAISRATHTSLNFSMDSTII